MSKDTFEEYFAYFFRVEQCCDITPEGRNNVARGDVRCKATARQTMFPLKWTRKQQQNNEITQPALKHLICKQASTTLVLLLKEVFSVRSVQSSYKWDNWVNPVSVCSVDSRAVKTRLGGWCEMAASLGPS
jgi:hypothetical protein